MTSNLVEIFFVNMILPSRKLFRSNLSKGFALQSINDGAEVIQKQSTATTKSIDLLMKNESRE